MIRRGGGSPACIAKSKPMSPNTETPPNLEDPLTWAVLLAQWTDFARSAVALPIDGEQGLMRASVTDIITLQAVWFSLNQLDALPRSEQALGINRAAILIERHRSAIEARFAATPLPEGLQSLLDDVSEALKDRSKDP